VHRIFNARVVLHVQEYHDRLQEVDRVTLKEAMDYAKELKTGKFIDPELFSKARGEAMVLMYDEINC
jgi:hypothetical protein